MPQVPVYDRPQVQRQALRGGEQTQVSDMGNFGAAQLQQAGQALASVAEVVDRIDQREDRRVADETEATVRREWLAFNMDAQQKLQGNRIGEYRTAAESWWKDAPKKFAKDASPRTQAMIGATLRTAQDQAMANVLGHYAAVTERNQDVSFESNMLSQVDWAVNQGSAAAVDATRQAMKATVVARGAAKGWDESTTAQQLTRYNSKMTVDFVSQLMRKDPKAAESYLAKAQADGYISGDAYTKMSNDVAHVGAIVDGKNAAAEVWKSAQPKTYNDPVDVFAMEEKVRSKYPNDPARQAAGIAAIKEYAASFNAAQKEFNSANVNSVYAAIDAGQPMTSIAQTEAWRALPGKERDAIKHQQEQRAYTRSARAAADANRAAANEGRELTRMKRENERLMLDNAGEYLRFTDPAVLAAIGSRAEVEATRALFGPDGARHLLERWDALQTAKGRVDAKMDKDDFDQIAGSMGFDLKPRPNTDAAKKLGDLHYRAEQVILAKQRAAGQKPLTREEKAAAVKEAVATEVLVDPGWWSPEKSVSVMALTADQLKDIVVPQKEKAGLAEKLRAANKTAGGTNPAYFPTEENLKRLYLRHKVPTPAVMPDAK